MQNDREIIKKLESIDLNDVNIEYIRALLFQLKSVQSIKSELSPENIIIRCRRGRNYTSRKDMSYKPLCLCQSYQRATLPNQTAFYGVLSDDVDHWENARAIGISECSALSDVESGREYMSVSLWKIKEPITTYCIVSSNSYLDVDVSGNRLLGDLRNFYTNKFPDNEDASSASDFIVREFSKLVPEGHDCEYKISATWADMILNTVGFEAIAYPSVQLGGQAGLNFALRPEVADSKLILDKIISFCLYKSKKSKEINEVWESYFDCINKCMVKNNNLLSDLKEVSYKLGVNANELQLL